MENLKLDSSVMKETIQFIVDENIQILNTNNLNVRFASKDSEAVNDWLSRGAKVIHAIPIQSYASAEKYGNCFFGYAGSYTSKIRYVLEIDKEIFNKYK